MLQANPAFLDDNAEKTKGWYPSAPEQLHVRSLRLIQKRSVKIPFMETFDQPDNFESCTRRLESTGAPQALAFDESSPDRGSGQDRGGTHRREAGDQPEAQITRAFTLILQRPPAAGEIETCLPLQRDRSLAEVCRVLLNTERIPRGGLKGFRFQADASRGPVCLPRDAGMGWTAKGMTGRARIQSSGSGACTLSPRAAHSPCLW